MPDAPEGLTLIQFNKLGDYFTPIADPNCNTTPPPPVDPDHKIILNTKIGVYLGTIPVYLKPGNGNCHHLVVEGYGVMASIPKGKCRTFGAMNDWFVFHLRRPHELAPARRNSHARTRPLPQGAACF